MACRLPVELSGEIISYLWNDNPTLEACSLTCRAMTHPSQKRLFHSVAIYPPPELLKAKYTNSWPSNATIGSFSKFRQLLDRSPHIAEYIISLHLLDLRWYYKAEMPELECPKVGEYLGSKPLWPEDFRWLLTDTSLPSYWPLLGKLKALTIEYDGYLCRGGCSTLLHTFQQPSLLCIRILCGPYPIKSLSSAIGPNVKHLVRLREHHLENERFYTFLSDPPSSPVYLDTLAIDYPSVFVSSLMSDPTFRLQTSRLRRLFISAKLLSSENQHLATWIILQTCSDILEEFEFVPCRRLTIQSSEEAVDDSEPIDLGKLTSLKKFTVTLSSVYIDQTTFDSYRWLSKIFRSANPQLEEISIHVHVLPIDTVPSSWKNMCDVLLTNFQALQRLDFVVDLHPFNKAETRMVVEAFNTSECIKRLRSCQSLNVVAKVCTDFLHRTSPDIRWESWDRNMWR